MITRKHVASGSVVEMEFRFAYESTGKWNIRLQFSLARFRGRKEPLGYQSSERTNRRQEKEFIVALIRVSLPG
jgi:hypothetical protein